MTKLRTRALLAATALGCVGAAVFAPPAHAVVGRLITVSMTWGPNSCIQATEPASATGRTTTVTGWACEGGFSSITYFAPVGTYIGIDPIIGENTHVGCSIVDANTGSMIWSDQGTLGDGHNITCLRILNTGDMNA